jgi:RNA polymerase sigma factor (sigma-70 family)
MISREEERELIRRVQQEGDEAARNQLIETHYRFIWSRARKYIRRCRGLEIEDLVQVGVLGMCRAIKKFDLSRTTGLLAYADRWIRNFMLLALRNQHVIHVPIISNDKHELAGRRAHRMQSLNAPARSDGAREFGDVIAETCDDEPLSFELVAAGDDLQHLRERLAAAMATLNDRERQVIEGRLAGKILQVVGAEIGVTRERVRQIETLALRKLRMHVLHNRAATVRNDPDRRTRMLELARRRKLQDEKNEVQ